MADITKLAFHSAYPAFKNNTIYTGTKTISGTTSGGLNTKTFIVTLDQEPDLLDIIFTGPSDGTRPTGAWFKKGAVNVATNNAGGGNPSTWVINSSLNGTTLIITATYVQQFTTSESLTSTDFSYRVVDYSVL